ncbi:MAG: hypothetical protein ABIJ15_05550 [bacterium]
MDLLKRIVGGMLKRVSLKAKGEMKMSKRILVGMMVIGMMAGVAYAGNPGTVNLTVTVTPTLSVAVPRTTYDFGTLGAAVASVAAESTAVINDSADSTEKYNLKASDALGLVPWTLATSTGTDQYTLHAQFNSTRPNDFGNGADDFNMTNADQTCDGIIFASAADQDGFNTPKGTEELLWFRIGVPSSVGSTDQKTIYITITALNQG